jgi:hypothetical protein
MPDRPLVYVAGPYAHPDPVANTHAAIRVADELNAAGLCTAFVPHVSMLWHYWYELDFAYLARCDALLRIPGESAGADAEVAFAEERGIPVFTRPAELAAWLESGG